VLLREPDTLRRVEARIGVIGPAAMGEPVHNGMHAALGLDATRGGAWPEGPG
jgi:hypothetical protein